MLNPKKLGVAAGLVWGLSMLLMTFASIGFDYGTSFLYMLKPVYLGYDVTPLGALIGFFWGFVDMFIFFFLIGWIYNRLDSMNCFSCCNK